MDQSPTGAPVPVCKRVNRLKLGVGNSRLRKRRDIGSLHEALKVAHRIAEVSVVGRNAKDVGLSLAFVFFNSPGGATQGFVFSGHWPVGRSKTCIMAPTGCGSEKISAVTSAGSQSVGKS